MSRMNSFLPRGFTLIELVVVITVLGILAAFAVPKFITLDSSARIAALNSLAGSVRSAATLARGMSMASQNPNTVMMEGSTITLLNLYPDGTATGIVAAVNTTPAGTDWVIQPNASASGTVNWYPVGAPTPSSCWVAYIPAQSLGQTPAVNVWTTGC